MNCLIILWELFVLSFTNIIDLKRNFTSLPLPLRRKYVYIFCIIFYLVIIMFLYTIFNLIALILLNFDIIQDGIFFIENYIINFSIAIIFIISFIYLHLAFSGLPFISEIHSV